jgi:hypothetical protein
MSIEWLTIDEELTIEAPEVLEAYIEYIEGEDHGTY